MTSDESLYERLVGGDMTAFDALYARYERPLYGFIRRYVDKRAEAEELFQEVFLAVLREQRKQRTVHSFRAWVYSVARNLCLNRLRSHSREKRAMDKVASDTTAPTDDPVAELISVEATARIERAVSRLPAKMGELYALRARGMSYAEVASVLDVPLGTVKSRMNTMLKSLREEIANDM